MIYHQEMIFRESFIAASGLKEPKPPEEQTEESVEKYQKALRRFDMKLDEEIKKALEKNKVPRGVVGLPEDGDRSVSYRFMGDVYEDTALIYSKNQSSFETCKRLVLTGGN